MTVTYSAEVATSSFACFLKLLFRWKGSIYKLLWKDFLFFNVAYFSLSFVHRFALNEYQKDAFARVAHYCEEFNKNIPLSFVLGFYVSIVINRWWAQFERIPWPDRMAMFVTANVHGQDERGRLMRRTMMRYMCLSFVITMSSISPGVKKRFPTFEHMAEAGFMQSGEDKIIDGIQTQYNKYFIPLAWCTSLISRARKEGRIKDDFAVKTLIDEVNAFRGCLGDLFNYDWISIPLVYTQVVTIAVYTFFVSCLMGRQFTSKSDVDDMYVPIFTFLQFFFYMGWLKVAESLVNPFGDDDDDFDINSCIDRSLQVSYLMVDQMHSEHPELIRDQYWDEVDFNLPYTKASKEYQIPQPYIGSAMDIRLSLRDRQFITTPSMQRINKEQLQYQSQDAKIHPQQVIAGNPANTQSGVGQYFRFLKRSFSRQSNRTDQQDSPSMSNNRRRKAHRTNQWNNSTYLSNDSIVSGQTGTIRSTSVTTNNDEIFAMDMDLSEGEDVPDQDGDGSVPSQRGVKPPRTSPLTSRSNPIDKPRHGSDGDNSTLVGSKLSDIVEDSASEEHNEGHTSKEEARVQLLPNNTDQKSKASPQQFKKDRSATAGASPRSVSANSESVTKGFSLPQTSTSGASTESHKPDC